MSKPRVIGVIPARFASSRFPGKVLATIAGKPMVQWVYERARLARQLDDLLIATDDDRVVQACRSFGAQAVLTSPNHATGSDRIAEAIRGRPADLIVNIQGDEPLVPPSVLDDLVAAMLARPQADMGTVAVPIPAEAPELHDPNVVKVVCDAQDFALYFSRAPIPFARHPRTARTVPLRHWGIYAFRRSFFEAFVAWPQGDLECCESLEQLRALEHGGRIFVLRGQVQTVGVDVPEDVPRAEALMRQQGLWGGPPSTTATEKRS
jgi:3-deoxy-manno-octulosonate cytidylyltransferase (CMP-KDO synthetase)